MSNTTSSLLFDQRINDQNFHKHSSSSGSVDEAEEDDFDQTYNGEMSQQEANNADNKYSQHKMPGECEIFHNEI